MAELPIDSYFLNRAKSKRDGEVHAYQTLTPAKTALVVVDMQNYFVAEGMPSYCASAVGVAPNINRLAEAVRATGGLVVWIQTDSPADPADWANRAEATSAKHWAERKKFLAKDGAGFPIHESCDVHAEDEVAIKIRYSAFIPHPSELDDLLRAKGIDTMMITGVATSTCCESTGRDASMWGYRTIMVADANADATDQLHRHTLGKFLITFGDVQTTDQLIEKLTIGATEGATEGANVAVPAQ